MVNGGASGSVRHAITFTTCDDSFNWCDNDDVLYTCADNVIFLVLDVIFSMEHMKMSAMIATPEAVEKQTDIIKDGLMTSRG